MQNNPYPEQAVLRELLRHYNVLLKPQVRRYLNAYLTDEQINKLFAYMLKRQMLYLDEPYIALNKSALSTRNDKWIQSFWVLLTMPALIYHHPSDWPIQIYFLTENDGEGQIIYAALGEECLLNSFLAEDDAIKRFIIVENPEQILILDIAGVQYYCTVDEKGRLAKYIKT